MPSQSHAVGRYCCVSLVFCCALPRVRAAVCTTKMRRRKRVLRRLGHCSSEGVIQLKGRVACEINTCDEMVVTELIFSGAFTKLTPEQSAALLSCMVHQVSFRSVNRGGTTRKRRRGVKFTQQVVTRAAWSSTLRGYIDALSIICFDLCTFKEHQQMHLVTPCFVVTMACSPVMLL